jgi:argininosuccinate synthase
MKKVVLAYSGGLDTTYCAVYLSRIRNLEVHAVTIQTGGFTEEELKTIKAKAVEAGVASFRVIDVTEAYYQQFIRYLVYGNVLKNNTYPLSVSAERMVQALNVSEYAKELRADYIAHGSTGAGNDQVRFDMVFQSQLPGVEILTPIRDQKLSREQELAFLYEHGIDISFQKAAYSINKGLWGTSVGGKETLSSNGLLPEDAWPTPVTKTGMEKLILHFTKGELTGINDLELNGVATIQMLQAIAQPFGIGRDIHVGDTIIGIKGRVGFEAAAALLIIKGHHLLEKHTLTKWQQYWKEQLGNWYGNFLHEGLYLDPVMRNIEVFLKDSQEKVTGKVFAELHPYRFVFSGVETEHDLMNNRFGAYGEMNNSWTGDDVRGFAKIFNNQVSIFHNVNSDKRLTSTAKLEEHVEN